MASQGHKSGFSAPGTESKQQSRDVRQRGIQVHSARSNVLKFCEAEAGIACPPAVGMSVSRGTGIAMPVRVRYVLPGKLRPVRLEP